MHARNQVQTDSNRARALSACARVCACAFIAVPAPARALVRAERTATGGRMRESEAKQRVVSTDA
eukprot:1702946-Pleurochrysis_carterae.AAC.3